MQIQSLYTIYENAIGVQTDTRKIVPGELFFALSGDNFNGNIFAKQALEKGAIAAVIDDKNYYIDERTILVENSLYKLQQLANYHRKQFTIPILAITGSNGKTTTKELITTVLSTQYKVHATKGNLNNHIGVPLTLLAMKKNTDIAVIEMGANHQKEIASYCEVAAPNYGLINNCGKAHLEGFGGVEGVKKGKGELYDYIRNTQGSIFINSELDYLQEMSQGIEKQITYGSTQSKAIYKGTIFDSQPFLTVAITTANNECMIQSQLVGDYNFPNIMAAVAVGKYFGISIEKIKTAIESYSPDNSRSQRIINGSNTFIMDAYNANPTSVSVAIKNFAQAQFPNKTILLGAMMELGEDSITEHQAIIALLEKYNWNHVILVGGDFKNTKHGYTYFENTDEAKAWYQMQQFENMAFLIKGSRAIAMEKIISK